MPDALVARITPDGLLRLRGQVLRCALGKGGVRPAAEKREGDGATPTGLLPLRRVLYRADRVAPPACAVPKEPLSPSDGWCDDPDDRAYNQPVQLPYPGRHEVLWRADAIYDIIGVLGWNDGLAPHGGDAPVQRGRGSAIFLHLARPDYAPTEGCVALSGKDLRLVLAEGVTALEVLG